MAGKKGKKEVPFCKPSIGKGEIDAVVSVLESGWLTTGSKAKEFEEMLCRYNSAQHAIAVSSCTAALHLCLAALGIGKGDEVITSDFTFCSTANVAIHCGAKPVLADIDKKTFNILPEEVEKKVTGKTKAIVPVHYAGQCCNMKEINRIAKEKGIAVVEDAAHAIGAEYKGKKAGTLGTAGCFSFYPIKNITTVEGGAIISNDKELAEKARLLSLHGISKDAWKRYSSKGSWFYEVEEAGFKNNMSDVQAALGIEQLKKLDRFIEKRESLSRAYDKALGKSSLVETPFVKKGVRHARHLYPILLNTGEKGISREDFILEMGKKGVGTSVHFIPLHLHPFYRKRFGFERKDFPNALDVFERIVSLPLYPAMEKEDARHVADAVLEVLEGKGARE